MGIVIDERDERDVVDEVADDESDAFGEWHEDPDEGHTVARLRATLAWVVGLNFGYFFIEMTVALLIGSVSLFADSVDFLEDTAVNALILLALGWSLAHRAKVGRVMAVIIVMPAVAAIWQAISKVANPEAPDFLSLLVTAGGAIVVNSLCAWLLARYRDARGSLTTAAFLAARNDIFANLAIIVMAFVTAATKSGWPDIILGLFIVVLNLTAAKEVWEVAGEEELAAKALAGEEIDDD